MKFELINNEYKESIKLTNIQIRFNLIKSSIKKDLEVVSFQHKASKVFGEFQIYSDFKSELNSFENFLTFLIEDSFDYVGESVEAKVSCRCPEHFLNLLITVGYVFSEYEIDQLASKYANYILEASELIKCKCKENLHYEIIELDRRYFGGNDPTAIAKYLNPKILNN